MTAPNVTVWRHLTTSLDGDGFVMVQADQSSATHAISGGGFANGMTGSNSANASVDGSDVSPSVHLVGSFPYYDSGSDTTVWTVIFAGTPGASIRAHVFAILA